MDIHLHANWCITFSVIHYIHAAECIPECISLQPSIRLALNDDITIEQL